MKARIKETGEIIEVKSFVYSRLDCNSKIVEEYDEGELDFGNEENEHWKDVRERAAIAALQGLSANPMLVYNNSEEKINIIARAMRYADELIEELRK